jgi:hypothetical protein
VASERPTTHEESEPSRAPVPCVDVAIARQGLVVDVRQVRHRLTARGRRGPSSESRAREDLRLQARRVGRDDAGEVVEEESAPSLGTSG